MQGTEMNRDEEIRQLAYKIWLEEGCPDGCDVEHWLRAAMIWEEIHRLQSQPKQSRPVKGRKSRQTQVSASPE